MAAIKSNVPVIEMDSRIAGDLSVMLHRLLNAEAYGSKFPKSFVLISAPFDCGFKYPIYKSGIYA